MKQMIKNEDLRNVNGGGAMSNDHPRCTKCDSVEDYHTVTEGSGCDKKTYFVCNQCGYKWYS